MSAKRARTWYLSRALSLVALLVALSLQFRGCWRDESTAVSAATSCNCETTSSAEDALGEVSAMN